MRKSYLLLATAILFGTTFISCNKSDSTLPTNYHVSGIVDITMAAGSSVAYSSLNVEYTATSKTQEKVSLSLSGLPAGCGVTFSTPGGYPAFNTTMTLNDTAADPGTYPVKLVCEGSVTGKKYYSFNLTLPQIPQCTDFLLGSHQAFNGCSSGSNYTEVITASGTRNMVYLNNLEGSGIRVSMQANCNAGSYTIPSQTINGVTYSGYGYYSSATYFYVDYTRTSVSGTTSCTEYISL